jgi:hypothetical protein
MRLSELKKSLLQLEIPKAENRQGFLEVIGKQYHENINSGLYAYFINYPNAEIRSLFIETILELIRDKTGKTLTFNEPTARTEVKAGDGRIDIVISDSSSKSLILIENKIYHRLHNNLMDYWHYNPKVNKENKVGILLTLTPHEIPKNVRGNFINISHAEWVKAIRKNLAAQDQLDKPWIYLYDFLNTIDNISNTHNMNNQAKFYFENAQVVLEANKTIDAAHAFLNNQLQKIAAGLGWQLFGSEMKWKNVCDEKNDLCVYFTILLDDLLEGKLKYKIIIELSEKCLKEKDTLRKYLKSFEKFAPIDEIGDDEETYMHFASKTYVMSHNELAEFGETVLRHIMLDFAEIMIAAIKRLYPKIKKFDWEPNWLDQIKNHNALKSKKR